LKKGWRKTFYAAGLPGGG